jgi:hypothetical protein
MFGKHNGFVMVTVSACMYFLVLSVANVCLSLDRGSNFRDIYCGQRFSIYSSTYKALVF